MVGQDTNKDKATIQVSTETRDRLIALGGKSVSHEDVIKRMLDMCGIVSAYFKSEADRIARERGEERWIS